MSAQTRNDSRYERQAHAHVFSSRPHHERKASHLISCGEIGSCLGLQSSKTGTIPPQLRCDSAVWRCWPCAGKRVPAWGLGMGCGFRYSHQPETATRFEPLFRDALSAEGLKRKLQPTIRSKSGQQFPPGLGKERRMRRLVYSPSRAFSGVIGSERTWWPVACATAEATAASGVLMTTSPIDLAPNGPSARSSAQRPREYCRYPGAWAACSS